MEARENIQTNLKLLRDSLDSGGMRTARLLIHSLHPSELARLLESLPLHERAVIWEMVEPDHEGDVLVEVADEVRDGLLQGMHNLNRSMIVVDFFLPRSPHRYHDHPILLFPPLLIH